MSNFSVEEGQLSAQQRIFVQEDSVTTISKSQLQYLLETVEDLETSGSSWNKDILITFVVFSISSGITLCADGITLSQTAFVTHITVLCSGIVVSFFSGLGMVRDFFRKRKSKAKHRKKIEEIMKVFEQDSNQEKNTNSIECERKSLFYGKLSSFFKKGKSLK